MPSRGADGKLYFKIVYWGPSLGGKTTAVKWLFKKEGMAEGKMQSIVDPTGRTLFFDRMVAGIANVKLQIYTVAGQRRHKFQRKTILNGVDGIIFVWDAQAEQWNENVWSLDELIEHLGADLGKKIPIIVMVNKQDLPNIVKRINVLELFKEKGIDQVINPMTGNELEIQVYDTIAIQGLNVKRAFQQLARDAVLNYYNTIKKGS
ncbi:MAG: ATP/GTP-binding protein [Promethearchaeota archaeon]